MRSDQRPKRRHHHVWREYLRSWTVDGSIHCLQGGRIFRTGTRDVAVGKDFYKLRRPTAEDAAMLKTLFGNGHPAAVRTHAALLNRLALPFQLSDIVKEEDRATIDVALARFTSDVLEDYHAGVEASFLPLLARALRGDIGFYDDDKECIGFLHFLSTQYMRTRGIKERFIEVMPGLKGIWNVAALMSATNIGASLYAERKKRRLIFVANGTDTSFVTGDQPAINLKGARPHPPENLSVFYPISPKAALLLTDIGEGPMFPACGLTDDQARSLNERMREASHRQVFARCRSSLEKLNSEKPSSS